jgi:hypothetical protein
MRAVADSDHANRADTATSAGDANTFDGNDSTEFLGKTEKAADSDKLDETDTILGTRGGAGGRRVPVLGA